MKLNRRDFLRYAGISALALGLSQLELVRAGRVLADANSTPVIWLSGASCTGCSISLLNAVNPTIDQALINTISLKYHPNLMAASGDMAVAAANAAANAGGYVLVVEGAIPTGNAARYCYVWDEGGHSVTMADAVRNLAARASLVVAVGTCASYGGIPGRNLDSNVQGVGAFLGRQVVNLPGCPSHPDWIIGTLVKAIAGTLGSLDSNGRPLVYYPREEIHEHCPREEREEAHRFGLDGYCLKELGCKGPSTHADCATRKWNNGQNWCIGVNNLCLGCTEPSFPAFPLRRGGILKPQPTPATLQWEVPLSTGWNMVSLPIKPDNTSPAQLFAGIAPYCSQIFAYDAASPSNPWQHYAPSAPSYANTLAAVNESTGLWIQMNQAATLTFSGVKLNSATIPLQAGWNLISYPLTEAQLLTDVFGSIVGACQLLYTFDSSTPSNPWRQYDPSIPNQPGALTQLEPGKSYWVQMNQAATWVL